MFRFALAFVPLFIAGASACHSSSSNGAGDAPEPPKNGRFVSDAKKGGVCELPLSVYCADKTCEP
ncbi:MAG: hypothetical protein ABI183_01145, partial [Polyangiaceae bacterium]